MELWIRSQDRERLMKASDLRIAYVKEKEKWVVEDCDNLGYYSTRERALEVLDEIEEILMPKIKVVHNKVERKDLDGFRAEYIMQPMIEDVQVLEASSYVYKMPKE